MLKKVYEKSTKEEQEKLIVEGNFTQLTAAVAEEMSNVKDSRFVMDAIDTAALNPVWRSEFEKAISKKLKTKVSFDVLNDEDKESRAKYTITGGATGSGLTSIDDVFETTIMPVLDGLMYDNNAILSRVNRINVGLRDGNQSFELNEFGDERIAEELSELEEGTEVDDNIRDGDTITPKNKIQASTSVSEYALLTMNPTLLADFMARGIQRVQNKMVANILRGSNTNNQFKGIINSFGSTADDQQGALSFSSAGSTDNLDALYRMLGDMPDSMTMAEEARLVYIGRRTDFYQNIALVQNLNNDYKVNLGDKSIAELPFLFAGAGILPGEVLLADLDRYFLAVRGELRIMTDNAIANLKAGKVTVVFTTFADGGMAFAHKNVDTVNANDNHDRNMFRLLEL